MEYTISLQNRRVWEFYDTHKNMEFEGMSLLFIDILERIMCDTTQSLNSSIVTQLMDNIKSLQTNIGYINDNIQKINPETNSLFSVKFTEFKKEYTDDIKNIIASNGCNTVEKLSHIIDKYNDTISDKTKIIISDIIPKNQDLLSKNISICMKELQTSIAQEVFALSKTTINKDSLDNFITSIDDKFTGTLYKSQLAFNEGLNQTEQRINNKFIETNIDNDRRNQEIRELKEYLTEIKNIISQDSKSAVTKDTLADFIGRIDDKISNTFTNCQSAFNTGLSSTEQRLNTQIIDTTSKNEKSINNMK
jgi:hypothetical protein